MPHIRFQLLLVKRSFPRPRSLHHSLSPGTLYSLTFSGQLAVGPEAPREPDDECQAATSGGPVMYERSAAAGTDGDKGTAGGGAKGLATQVGSGRSESQPG